MRNIACRFRRLICGLLIGLTLVGVAFPIVAQNAGQRIVVTGIDSTTFPLITMYAMVFDENGFPVTGLEADAFKLYEDGQILTPISVEETSLQDLRVVLAIDTSTPPAWLAEVVATVEDFIDHQLTDQDQLAIMAFHHEVRLVQDFTNDKAALKAAVRSLVSEETYTALYQTVYEAANLVSGYPEGHKAVIVIADIQDNVHEMEMGAAVSKAQELNVPVHIIGYSPKIKRPAELHAIGQATGGLHFVLGQAAEVAEYLRITNVIIRQGYKVTFKSALVPDNAKHQITLPSGVEAAQTQPITHTFTATPNGITLTPLVDFVPAAVDAPVLVAGEAKLGVQTMSKADIEKVTYTLDGKPLAQTLSADEVISWDSSTVAIGQHTLRIEALNAAGETAVTEVPLRVIAPLEIRVAVLPEGIIKAGEVITVDAYVTAVAEIDIVELLLDGEVVKSATEPVLGARQTHLAAPPLRALLTARESLYRFTLDTTGLRGDHAVTARVTDLKGRQSEGGFTLQFKGLPWYSPQQLWFKITALVIALLLLVFALLLLPVILFRRRRSLRQECQVHLTNTGNARSLYHLQAGDLKQALRFEFLHDGSALPTVPVEMISDATTEVSAAAAPEPEEKAPAGLWGRFKKSVGGGNTWTMLVSGILISIGSILGPLGRPLVKTGQQIRQQQAEVMRVVRIPERKVAVYRRVQDQVKRVTRRPRKRGKTEPTEEQAPVAEQVPGEEPESLAPPAGGELQLYTTEWVKTPTLGPGDNLTLDLIIRPVKRASRRMQTFNLISQVVEDDPTLANPEEAALNVDEIRFRFKKASWLRLYLPALLWSGVIALLIVFIAVWVRQTGLLQMALNGLRNLSWPLA